MIRLYAWVDVHRLLRWQEEFKEVVSYRDFLIAFTGYFRSRPPSDPDDVRYRCLKAVLGETPVRA